MSEPATAAVVRRSITVQAPPERAFAVFTEQFGSWWPASHSIVAGGYGTAILEAREGGRWYERGATGAECEWGRVLAYEPPHRVVVTWQLDAAYRFDPDPARASEVEVRFSPAGDGTLVELEHRHFDRHGDEGEEIAGVVASPGGWPLLLAGYAELAAA